MKDFLKAWVEVVVELALGITLVALCALALIGIVFAMLSVPYAWVGFVALVVLFVTGFAALERVNERRGR